MDYDILKLENYCMDFFSEDFSYNDFFKNLNELLKDIENKKQEEILDIDNYLVKYNVI